MDPLNDSMAHMLLAAGRFFIAASEAYAKDMPTDAAAWATMLEAGRVAPGVRLEMAPSGPTVDLGYIDGEGTFHKFFSWPQPQQQPDPDQRKLH